MNPRSGVGGPLSREAEVSTFTTISFNQYYRSRLKVIVTNSKSSKFLLLNSPPLLSLSSESCIPDVDRARERRVSSLLPFFLFIFRDLSRARSRP